MAEDFVIENGVLEAYTGAGGDVVIPEGVTIITSRPFGWLIREAVLRRITSISFPRSLKKIEQFAFDYCDELKKFVVDENETYLAKDGVLFERLNKNDLKLLYFPAGIEGDYTYPVDVKEVYEDAFHRSKLSSVHFPKGAYALPRKGNLRKRDFSYISVIFEEGYVQTKEKILADYVDDIQINNETDCAYIAVYQTGKKWSEKITAYMGAGTDKTNAVIREMIQLLSDETDVKIIANSLEAVMAAIDVADHELIKSLYSVILEKKASKALKLLTENKKVQAILSGEADEEPVNGKDSLNPVEEEVKTLWKINNSTKKLADIVTRGIRYRDSEEICSDQVLKFVIAEYAEELDGNERFVSLYKTGFVNTVFNEKADQIADALNREDLQEVLEGIALTEKHWKDGYLIPFARFASPAQISKLTASMNKWVSEGPRGRAAVMIARGGLMLSDTREAMMAVDKTGGLSYYASLRGKDPDVLRDAMLSDFGFNKNGEKTYDLGENKVTVQVSDELQLTLYDHNAAKSVKSLPKKNADLTLYETARTDYSDLKKNIRKVYTNRKKLLFQAFLSSKEFAPEYWEEFYQGNPVLAAVTRLLVWQQDDHFFTLSYGKTVDYHEQEYSLDKETKIKLAYPTEMNAEELTGWQNYFMQKSLKQPFAQIWEPAYRFEDIKEDRYSGCTLPILRFSNKEEHGIWMDGLSSYSESFQVRLKDCSLECKPSVYRFVFGLTDDAEYELKSFKIHRFSRYANHIVSLLDKWTIEERIKKDDAAVIQALQGATVVQIKNYIKAAGDNNSSGCQAALLEYMHQNFEAFDPLAEYLLDED